ncbi:MAG: hypothetical protein ABIZ04_26500 [Opitutus sp.]
MPSILIAMTGHCGYIDDSTILKMAAMLGCRRTIAKPFSLFDFLETVYQLLHDGPDDRSAAEHS